MKRSHENVSDETEDSDSKWSDSGSGATTRQPIPDDQPLPKLWEKEFLVSRVIRNIMSYESDPTVTPKLHGISNLYEWRQAWEEHINSLAKLIDPIIKHYHCGLTDCERHKASVFDRYKTVDPKKLKKLRPEIDSFLRSELQKTIELREPAVIIARYEYAGYHKMIDIIMSVEKDEPHKLKAAEAYSYRKKKVILNNFHASREHEAVYEPDWVVRVVAESVDVTSFHIYSVAEVFKQVEEENLRERYRQLAQDNIRISKAQFFVEDRVRSICMEALKNPDKRGFQRANHKRFKSNKNKRREPQVTS